MTINVPQAHQIAREGFIEEFGDLRNLDLIQRIYCVIEFKTNVVSYLPIIYKDHEHVQMLKRFNDHDVIAPLTISISEFEEEWTKNMGHVGYLHYIWDQPNLRSE